MGSNGRGNGETMFRPVFRLIVESCKKWGACGGGNKAWQVIDGYVKRVELVVELSNRQRRKVSYKERSKMGLGEGVKEGK